MRFDYLDPDVEARNRLSTVGEILPGVMRRLRGQLVEGDRGFDSWWRGEVGYEVGCVTRVISWKKGLLTIGVPSPSHLMEFQVLYRDLGKTRKFRTHPPLPIDEIVFRLDDRRGRPKDHEQPHG